MGQPYGDVSEHLRDELRRAWLRVEYQIRLSWTKGQAAQLASEDVIGPQDMGKLFAAARGEGETATDEAGAQTILERWLEAHRAVEARIKATIAAGTHSPLVDILRVFKLTPRQWSALMFAVLPETDPNLISAYRYLARDSQCRGLDARLLAQLVYDTPESRSLMARDLSASSPLIKYRLVEMLPGDASLFRRIRPAARIIYALDGSAIDLDPELAELAELRQGPVSGSFPPITVERATSAMRSNEVVLVLQGQRGVGKKLLLQQAAAHWGQRLLLIDSRRLNQIHVSNQPPIMRSLARELKLLDALPAFSDIDDDINLEQEKDELPGFFAMLLEEWDGPVALTLNREKMPRIHQRPIVHVSLEVPGLDVRAQMWRSVMPSLTAEEADSLSGRFAIPGGIIVAAAQAATAERMPDAGPPPGEELARAVSGQLHQRITRLGKKLPTPFDIDDLIVDDEVRGALTEIAAAASQRRRIRENYKLRGAQGISVLFSGHPGVGKTMSGTVLAKRLGLDIYEIDLSQVVSKWLGETEKNLSDVFDAAEPGHVVLLFNEADSLFGKRTSDVKSSNDRYANMETNYLLQRLERFGGVAILTTNLTGAIDQAFKRRFTYDVFFSFPSVEMRAELWRRTLPQHQRGDIDFEQIAEKYELSGGFIKVASERAAYVSGGTNVQIDTVMLQTVVERMYRERGKVSANGRLE
ncbi:MAG TPA: ATP-binding protein [Kofleriaceae bacterium]